MFDFDESPSWDLLHDILEIVEIPLGETLDFSKDKILDVLIYGD